jgi:hypothetical protein
MIKGGPRPPGREPRIRLAGPARAGLRRAGQLQRVVEPLALGAIVFRVGLLAERLQHRAHRGRARGGQIILANAAQN